MKQKFLKIHPEDNVCVALTDLRAGEQITENGETFTLTYDVPAKHKFTIHSVNYEDSIKMYGVVVGKAVKPIPQGGIITTQNVKHIASEYHPEPHGYRWTAPDISRWKNKYFMGFHRKDGRVGVANYWLLIPLVFCENRNIAVLKQTFEEELGFSKRNIYKDYVRSLIKQYKENKPFKHETFSAHGISSSNDAIFKNISGIKTLTHEGGCGGTREDAESLCALLAGYINNPNVAGATVLSLGCQNAQIELLNAHIKKINPEFDKPLIVLEQQKIGTEEKLLNTAIYETFTALIEANKLERSPAPLSKLVVGLECGGSDGFSGISANPAVGHVSDILSALGGSVILSEFPELCGVEQEIINRCVNATVAGRFISLMRSYAQAAQAVGSGFDMNPSPGNIKDGLITDAMKSAGAAKKGGTSPVTAVLDYGEFVTQPGLNLLRTPGNDVESTTAMAGAGATLILFTTGLGTPTGNPVAPVIKISSNSALARKMPDIIDINAGSIIEGTQTIEQVGEDILEYMLRVASGELKTKAMELQQDDFIPWKRGVSL